MSINLLLFRLIQRHKAIKDVITSSGIVGTALVVGEIVLHWADGKFLLEAIDLVKEQDDGCLDKPSRVANGVEQGKCFLHTVDRFVFEEQLVIFGDGYQEENRRHIFEAVNPLLTLRPLTTDIEHPVGQVANNERRFRDTGGLDTRTKDILVGREIVRLGNAVDGIEVTDGGVVLIRLILIGSPVQKKKIFRG